MHTPGSGVYLKSPGKIGLKPAAMKSHKDSNHVNQTAVTHKDFKKKLTITHEEEKITLIL